MRPRLIRSSGRPNSLLCPLGGHGPRQPSQCFKSLMATRDLAPSLLFRQLEMLPVVWLFARNYCYRHMFIRFSYPPFVRLCSGCCFSGKFTPHGHAFTFIHHRIFHFLSYGKYYTISCWGGRSRVARRRSFRRICIEREIPTGDTRCLPQCQRPSTHKKQTDRIGATWETVIPITLICRLESS